MASKIKTPVFFVATKTRKEPVTVNFYTKRGQPVSFGAVRKVKTKDGVHFYASAPRANKR